MPYTWLGFSTATKPFVDRKSPLKLKADIDALSGGTLQELFFDVSRDVAYALFKDLGDSADTKRLSLELGGVEYCKMLDAQQADPIYAAGGAWVAAGGVGSGDEGGAAA
jgi:hypothetical protein